MKTINAKISSNRTYTHLAMRAQLGFTLVELMVGMLLGLFIIGIALTYMTFSIQSFKINANDNFIQENARFTMSLVARNLRRAGVDTVQQTIDGTLNSIVVESVCPDKNGNGSATACAVDDLSIHGDRLAYEYVTDLGVTCNKQTIDAAAGGFLQTGLGGSVIDLFWVEPDADGINTLYCHSYLRDSTGTLNAANNSSKVALIGGVDLMKVLYGVDTDGDSIVNQYLPLQGSDGVLQGGYADNILTVKIAMLINSGLKIQSDANTEMKENKTYTVLGTDYTVTNDRMLRQIHSTTIALPNAQ